MQPVDIVTFGTNLEVSSNGGALEADARKLIEPELSYVYRESLHGVAAYDNLGVRKPIRTEHRRLYVYDGYGRLVCKSGFRSRICDALHGHNIRLKDATPPHPRPDRFAVDWDALFAEFTPRANQDQCLARIVSNTCGMIEAPTGWGKSHMYRMLTRLFGNANILIIVTRADIAKMLVTELTRYVPNVGQIGAGRKDIGRVTVCMAQSLKHIDVDQWDIVIGEEAHELAAPAYIKHLARLKWSRNYGFSASPWDRADGTSIRLEGIFGPTIFKTTYQEAVSQDVVVPIHVEWLDVMMPVNPCEGMVDTPRKRHGIWRNEYRNQLIAKKAKSFASDEQVLVMVTTFEHAVYLKQFLPDFTLCYAQRAEDDKLFTRFVDSGMLSAEEPRMTTKRREQLRRDFEQGNLKKVIATGVWSTGVDFRPLQVLIRADASGSTIMDTQIPGRVSRISGDKPYGLVIDCMDQFDRGFNSAARKRRKNYEQKGWRQIMPGGLRIGGRK